MKRVSVAMSLSDKSDSEGDIAEGPIPKFNASPLEEPKFVVKVRKIW